MNIHPLFVHFPIGILSLYVGFECLRFKFITKRAAYFEIKTVLSVIGVTSAYLAAGTGDMAEELKQITAPEQLPLIETHAMYAIATVTTFSILAGSYLYESVCKVQKLRAIKKIPLLATLSKYIQKFAPVLAVVGLVLITITGGLGASIVYGPDVDPFVRFIYNTFTTLK